MVLKIVLFFSLFLSIYGNAYALGARSKYIKKAKIYHKKKRYNLSNKALRKVFNFRKTKTIPASVLYLYGLNKLKAGKYPSSIYYFNKFIKRTYAKKHRKILAALAKEELEEEMVPKLLRGAYYYLGQSHYKIFTKKKKLTNAKKAKLYFQICDEIDFNDKCADFIENIEEKIVYKKKSIKKIDFYISAGTLIFQDKVTLTGGGKPDTSIYANNTSLCYGAGLRYGNSFKGYMMSGCIFSGNATVATEATDSVEYNQSGVPIAGLMMEAGYYYKPLSEKTRLTLSIPILYRSGLYKEPAGYKIEGSKQTSYGLALSGAWQIWILEGELKLANLGNTNLVLINGIINF